MHSYIFLLTYNIEKGKFNSLEPWDMCGNNWSISIMFTLIAHTGTTPFLAYYYHTPT